MEKLLAGIRQTFEHDYVNTEEVRRILEEYKSDPREWRQYAHFDPHKYTRNLVDVGNGKYNLMILCWGPGMGSSIHDHTDAHCFVKVLDGSLLETRFAWPSADKQQQQQKKQMEAAGEDGMTAMEEMPLMETGTEHYGLNGVSYISDQIGLHRMENPSHSDVAVTLHLYIPPFSHCQVFDQRTGRRQKCNVTFYTKFGQKVDYSAAALAAGNSAVATAAASGAAGSMLLAK